MQCVNVHAVLAAGPRKAGRSTLPQPPPLPLPLPRSLLPAGRAVLMAHPLLIKGAEHLHL